MSPLEWLVAESQKNTETSLVVLELCFKTASKHIRMNLIIFYCFCRSRSKTHTEWIISSIIFLVHEQNFFIQWTGNFSYFLSSENGIFVNGEILALDETLHVVIVIECRDLFRVLSRFTSNFTMTQRMTDSQLRYRKQFILRIHSCHKFIGECQRLNSRYDPEGWKRFCLLVSLWSRVQQKL